MFVIGFPRQCLGLIGPRWFPIRAVWTVFDGVAWVFSVVCPALGAEVL